jgi:hypothetical protein
MAKYIVKSPVDNYNGISASVQFSNGVGTTDSDNTAEWLRRKGYKVTEEKGKKPAENKQTK